MIYLISNLDEEGNPVKDNGTLDKLWAHATQPKYAWGQQWRIGDPVLWDNRCCMHYRSEVDATQPRVLYRTVVKGDPVIAG